jgi:ribosomal-protein-alanine N-acetyltransferase
MDIQVIWMKAGHAEDILRIETLSFDSPWSQKQFFEAWQYEKSYTLVAQIDSQLVGYLIYSRCRDKLVIENLAVDRSFRRKGVGKKLVEAVIDNLGKRDCVELNVSDSNLNAHLFLRSLGFKASEVKRAFYNTQDAYLFSFYPAVLIEN